MIEFRVDVPANEWLTANGRLHWREKAKRTATLRDAGYWWSLYRTYSSGGGMCYDRATCTATIHYPANRRQDPANASPTVKALIDGCVDAGLLPDDDAGHLTRVSFERGEPTGRKGWYAVTLKFEEVE